MSRETEIPCTVTCGWCNTPVPDDSEAPDGFCSDNCFETNRADDYGCDYDSGPNTSDRGILRDEFHR